MDERIIMHSQIQAMITSSNVLINKIMIKAEQDLENAAERLKADLAHKEYDLWIDVRRIVKARNASKQKAQECDAMVNEELEIMKNDTENSWLIIYTKHREKMAEEQKNLKEAVVKFTEFYSKTINRYSFITDQSQMNPAQRTYELQAGEAHLKKKLALMMEDLKNTFNLSSYRVIIMNHELFDQEFYYISHKNKLKCDEILNKLRELAKSK